MIPMYSMSTETLETVGHFENNKVSFLPLASQVLYEFIEEGLDDQPGRKTCGLRINLKWGKHTPWC